MSLSVLNVIPRLSELEAVDLSADRAEWLSSRARGVGGSDVAAILGLSPWCTPLQLWRRKTGLDQDSGSSWPMRVGTRMEAEIADAYQTMIEAPLFDVPFLRDREHPHRVASLDRIALTPQGARIIEIKWASRGLDEVPPHYYCQVQWYLAMTGLEHADLVVGDPWHEPVAHSIDADREIAASMIEAVDRWWADHVVAGVPPDPTTPTERQGVALERLRGVAAEVEAPEVAERVAAELQAAKAARDSAEATIRDREAALAGIMADTGASRLRGAGWIASMVERAGSIRYAEAVKAMGIEAEVLEQYRGKPSRYLTVRTATKGRK